MSTQPNHTSYQIAVRIAAVAGVFILVAGSLMLYDYSRRRAKDPLEDPGFKALILAIDQQPTNDALKLQIRELDLQLRREYFRQRAFTIVGSGLLLLASAVFLLAVGAAATIQRRLPTPAVSPVVEDAEERWTATARWAVGGLCLLLGTAAIVLKLAVGSVLHREHNALVDAPQPAISTSTPGGLAVQTPASTSVANTPAPTIMSATTTAAASTTSEKPPDEDELRKMWPRFRGPDGSGISAYANVPETWNVESGENIVWKTPVPLPGNNSPVVWDKRVFLSGADKDHREVYCFDADSGKMLWHEEVPSTPQSTARTPTVSDGTGYAASTTTTDGRRMFAIFANGDLAAFDIDGKPVWHKSLGIPESSYGFASSLCMWRHLLLVQFDQGSSRAPKSKLFAFNSATGEVVWQVDRPVPNSWSTPIVIRVGQQDQIITSADPWVIAYQPADGAEIWRAKCLKTDIGPSPVFVDGKVFVANDNADLSAIRADGKGDATATHIAWKGEDGMPDTCSPLATKEFLFLMTSFGTLTCYDAATGEMLWAEDFEGNFSASPGLAGNRLYLVSKEGTTADGKTFVGRTYIVEPTREKCNRLGEAALGEECVTSPAFQDGRIYLRGKDHLFCIGKP